VYVKRGRENTARPCGIPCALARHQRPGALAQQAATAPCPRPQCRHRGGPPAAAARGRVHQGPAPRHNVQSRVQKQKAHSRAEHWSFPRAPQAQDKAPRQEGSKTASRAAHNKRKQPAFANKCDAHHTGLRTAGGAAVRRDGRLAVVVLQNNSTAEKGVRGGGRSQGKHLRRVRHVKVGPVETRRRGTSTTHIAHQHTRWANSRGRGQQQRAYQW